MITEDELIAQGWEKRRYWHKQIGRYAVTVWKAKSGAWVAEIECATHHTTIHDANFHFINTLTKH